MKITGEFEVKLEPIPSTLALEGISTSRFSLRKTFFGALDATATGEMMAAGRANGVGAYVALDIVEGSIEGHEGSFILTHVGTRTTSAQALSVAVVPGSGTDELATLAGTLNIRIEGGKHFYDFEYTL